MKKQFLFFIIFLNVLNCLAERVVILGNVQHTKATSLQCSFNEGIISDESVKKDIPIDKKGNFKFELDVKSLTKVNFVLAEQYTSFQVQPGDSLSLKINYLDFINSIVFSGKNSAKNNFEKEFTKKFVLGHEQEIYQQIALRKAIPLANYCDSLLKVQLDFVDSYKGKVDLRFIVSFRKDLIYKSLSDKLSYRWLWAYLNNLKDSVPEMPHSYFNFIKNISLNEDSLLLSELGFQYLKDVVDYYLNYIEITSGKKLNYDEKMNVSKTLITNESNLLAYNSFLIINYLKYEKFAEAEKVYTSYLKINPNSPYLKVLIAQYEKVRSIAPGQNAPTFTLVNDKGKNVSLQDFKGKIVYIDFWASWCGPCVRELSYSKKIKPQFEGKDIVFVYISLDEDVGSWKEGIAQHAVNGVNLIAPSFTHPVCKAYNIEGVPSYFLIGRDGKMIDNNPASPSSEDVLVKLLNKALVQ